MAKTKEAEPEAITPAAVVATFDPTSMEAVLAEYGITQADAYIPVAPTVVTAGFEELCELTGTILDTHGNDMGVESFTPPLLFLEKTAERDSVQYAGYDGYYQFAVWHPSRGKTLVSHSRPKGEEVPNVVKFLLSIKKGAIFQVGQFKTNSGYKVFNPIPVQQASLVK